MKISFTNYIFILHLFLLSCTDSTLKEEDYKIFNLILRENVEVSLTQLHNDKKFFGMDKNSQAFQKKIIESFRNQDFESTYYFSIDDSTFSYQTNIFIEMLFREYDFRKKVPENMTIQKIDFSKIQLRKNLVRINKNNSLSKSENYIGDFKLSTILYEGNKATIIISENGREGVAIMYFVERKDDSWIINGSKGIPYKYGDKVIIL